MMNFSLMFMQTAPSGILWGAGGGGGGGGCSALMQSAAHCYPTLFKIKMLKCSSCFDLETKPHCKSKHELAWPRSPLLTSGLDSKPSRCGSQFGEATLQMVPAYSIKTFIWKKFLTATERGGKKGERSHEAGHSPILVVEKPLESSWGTRTWRMTDKCLNLYSKGKQVSWNALTGTLMYEFTLKLT